MKEPYVVVSIGHHKHQREHILVMERMLGHKIPKGYHVHHINGNPRDNRPENLVLLTHKEHRRIHTEIRRRRGEYLTKEEIAEAARKRSSQYRATHKDEIRKKLRAYYWDNRESALKKGRMYRESHREELRAKAREYRKINHARILQRGREYEQAHREERRAAARAYRLEHLEEIRKKNHLYRIQNRDKISEKSRQYRVAHKEELAEKARMRRASMTPEQREKYRSYHSEYYMKHKSTKKGLSK